VADSPDKLRSVSVTDAELVSLDNSGPFYANSLFSNALTTDYSSTISLPWLPPVKSRLMPSMALLSPCSLWARYLSWPAIR
jgi:hypothetical protein